MMKCELCGGKADLVDHYEEHIDPPRKINICWSCHSSTEEHNVLRRKGGSKMPRKNEYRVFLGKAEAEWISKLVEEGDLGRTHSEVIRTILRDVRRGLIK